MNKTRTVGNGEGSLFYSETQKIWMFQYYENGKRKTVKQKKNELVKDFKTRITKLKNQLIDGTHIEKRTETIISILEQHIKSKNIDGITADGSYAREMETLAQIKRVCNKFCDKPIQKVTIRDIESIKEDIKQFSNSCISKIWRLLNKAFEIAASPSRKILNVNIMLDIELKKPISNKKTEKVEALTEKERNKLISILDKEERNHKYRNIVKMQLLSGMRIGEVVARSINDYNEKTKQFNVHNTITKDKNKKVILGEHTKTYNKRTQKDEGQRYLPLTNSLFSEIIDIIEEQKNKKITNIKQLIFWDYETNNFVCYNSINCWLRRINEKYKICNGSLSTHKLRHTAITHWRNIGVPYDAMQYLAGHIEGSNITSDVYIDTSLDYVERELRKIV